MKAEAFCVEAMLPPIRILEKEYDREATEEKGGDIIPKFRNG